MLRQVDCFGFVLGLSGLSPWPGLLKIVVLQASIAGIYRAVTPPVDRPPPGAKPFAYYRDKKLETVVYI